VNLVLFLCPLRKPLLSLCGGMIVAH